MIFLPLLLHAPVRTSFKKMFLRSQDNDLGECSSHISNRNDGQETNKTRVIMSGNYPLTQSASSSVLSFSFFLLQLPLLPPWLSLQFTFGRVPMPLNRLHPASSLSVCLLHSELNQEESRINCILFCPLTDIARSLPPMGDRWQRIAAIFKGTYCLSQCCLRERTATPHTPSFSASWFLRVHLRSVCVEYRAEAGRESPDVPPGDLSLFIDHISPGASASHSLWLVGLEGESRDGFKAGLTLTSSGTKYLDKEQAHEGHRDTPS